MALRLSARPALFGSSKSQRKMALPALEYVLGSLLKQIFLLIVISFLQHLGAVLLILSAQLYFFVELSKYGIKPEAEAKLGYVVKGGFYLLSFYKEYHEVVVVDCFA